MLPAERRRRIVEELRARGALRVSDLVVKLGVSDVTTRRDLEELERRGLLERTHGGAILPGAVAPPVGPAERASAKRAIGAAAARRVEPGDAVYLNGGTTALEVFRHLSVPATVITNNVLVALEPPRREIELVLVGGHVRVDPTERTVVGPLATEALRRTFATRAFLGAGGISDQAGITTPVAAEAEIARVMIEQTRREVTVVADGRKVGAVSEFQVGSLEHVARLVTDASADDDSRNALEAAGVAVDVVSAEDAVR